MKRSEISMVDIRNLSQLFEDTIKRIKIQKNDHLEFHKGELYSDLQKLEKDIMAKLLASNCIQKNDKNIAVSELYNALLVIQSAAKKLGVNNFSNYFDIYCDEEDTRECFENTNSWIQVSLHMITLQRDKYNPTLLISQLWYQFCKIICLMGLSIEEMKEAYEFFVTKNRMKCL